MFNYNIEGRIPIHLQQFLPAGLIAKLDFAG